MTFEHPPLHAHQIVARNFPPDNPNAATASHKNRTARHSHAGPSQIPLFVFLVNCVASYLFDQATFPSFTTSGYVK